MNYEFSLNKNAVISMIAGSVVFALLLFIAGLIVGSHWLTGEAAGMQSAMAKNEKDELPKEPVLAEAEAPAPKPAAPKNVNPEAPQPKPPATPAATTAAATAQAAVAPLNDGEIKIIEEAAADPANAAEADPEYVTVQIGVFRDENEANHLLKQIESKGYAPTFFSGRDAEARQWYAVRIGAYSDRQQAANAAANFSKQEKLKAVVRPLGSL